MDFNADNNDHGEHGIHVVGHRSHLQPVPLLLGRQYDTLEDARLSIKHQLQDSGLPYATKFANKIRFSFVCPKIRSNTTQQCDFIVTARLQKESGMVDVTKCNLMHSCGMTLELSLRDLGLTGSPNR
jgi:hypothetical protein